MSFNVTIPEEVLLPCYRDLLYTDVTLNVLWGGRDSGKSYAIAELLVIECLMAKYFRCILIRKNFNTIKESQWQTIKDVVDKWGLSHLFTFNKSPLEIICKNGNRFLCKGCDDPQSIKSVRNPSHAWYEEANQLTEEDFIVISTTLRYDGGEVKEYLSFNPECDGNYEKFWIFKQFCKENYRKKIYTFTSETEVPLPDGKILKRRFNSIHTTYNDNPYCPPSRIARIEQLRLDNPHYYQVFALGLWGNLEGVIFAYDKIKRVKREHIPENQPEGIISYIDWADEGEDSVAMPIGKVYPGKVFITDVVFSNANLDITMPLIVEALQENEVEYVRSETNNQGSVAMKMLDKEMGWGKEERQFPVYNSTHKITRIKAAYRFIIHHMYFLDETEYEPGSQYDLFMQELFSLQSDGSSEHDDAGDSASGLTMFILNYFEHLNWEYGKPIKKNEETD